MIANHAVADDVIQPKDAIFTVLTATLTLAGTSFATRAPTSISHRILYCSATGQHLDDTFRTGIRPVVLEAIFNI